MEVDIIPIEGKQINISNKLNSEKFENIANKMSEQNLELKDENKSSNEITVVTENVIEEPHINLIEINVSHPKDKEKVDDKEDVPMVKDSLTLNENQISQQYCFETGLKRVCTLPNQTNIEMEVDIIPIEGEQINISSKLNSEKFENIANKMSEQNLELKDENKSSNEITVVTENLIVEEPHINLIEINDSQSHPKNKEKVDDKEDVPMVKDSLTLNENQISEVSDLIDMDSCGMNIDENITLIEIGRATWKSDLSIQKYLRGCLWSPDGTCVLTAVNEEGMQIFELPSDLYQSNTVSKSERKINKLVPAVTVQESGMVYDYNWFPHMNSNDPTTCCWIATRQHEPMHMWDAFTGELRATYRGYDQYDEVETAISSIFSPDGEYVIGGYKKSLKIFQTSIPGRDYTEIKSKCALSALIMHYNNHDMILSGSWNSTINLFDIRATNLGCLTTITGHSGGITLLKFDSNGEKLFSGARKDNLILQWDLRNFKYPVTQYKRNIKTNQRIYFDISSCNKFLFTGGTDGVLRGWNVNEENKTEFQFNLHNDCCNGVGFSAIRPVMCTTSGQYKFLENDVETGSEFINSKRNDIEIKYENSLILWWYGNSDE